MKEFQREIRAAFRKLKSGKSKHIRIVHKNGEIIVTGDCRSITVNGKKVL